MRVQNSSFSGGILCYNISVNPLTHPRKRISVLRKQKLDPPEL